MSGAADLGAIILAGGAGTRLGGADKGWLAFRGQPLIEHAIARLRACGIERIVVNANRNLERYRSLGHAVVCDGNDDFAGPLAGIIAGLGALDTRFALTIPVDVPGFPIELPDRLRKAMGETRLDATPRATFELTTLGPATLEPTTLGPRTLEPRTLEPPMLEATRGAAYEAMTDATREEAPLATVIATDGIHRQPLFALYSRALALAAARAAFARGERAVHRFQSTLRFREIAIGDPSAYRNMNTPEHYA